jgi:hypothetical protein
VNDWFYVSGAQIHTYRTGDSSSSESTVPIGILVQILLVIVLGVIKRRRISDLRRDAAVAGLRQFVLKRRA